MTISPVGRTALNNAAPVFSLNNVTMDDADRIYQERIDGVKETYAAYQRADGDYTEAKNNGYANADEAEAALANAKLKFAKQSIALLKFIGEYVSYAASAAYDLGANLLKAVKKAAGY